MVWSELIENQAWMFGNASETAFTVLLMAGIHPEEEAGVFCLKRLMENVQWLDKYKNIRVIMVPCRNLLGFHIRNFFFENGVLRGTLVFEDDSCEIAECDGQYLIFLKKSMIVQPDRRIFWDNLKKSLREAKVRGFVHLISYRKNTDLRANTYFFSEHEMMDLNVLGEENNADFICDIQMLIDSYKPDLVVDLHEGKGSRSYLYVDSEEENSIALGKHIVECWQKSDIIVRENAADRIRVSDGVYALDQLESGRRLRAAVKAGKVVVLEVGIENELKDRMEALQIGVKQSIAFEWGLWKNNILS